MLQGRKGRNQKDQQSQILALQGHGVDPWPSHSKNRTPSPLPSAKMAPLLCAWGSRIRAQAGTHAGCTHAHTSTHICMHTLRHIHTNTHTCPYTNTRTHAHTHAHAHTLARRCSSSCRIARSPWLPSPGASRTHAHTHARAHARAHTGEKVFKGLSDSEVILAVVTRGARPEFPSDCPSKWVRERVCFTYVT